MPERFFFVHFLTTFLKKCSRPSVRSVILKIACKQNLQKGPSRHPKSCEKLPYWVYLYHIEICKIHWKNVYFCFMALLGVHVVCHVLFGLCCSFLIHTFRCNSHRFFQKCAPHLCGQHISKKRLSAFCLQKFTFLDPSSPQMTTL